MFFKSKKTNTNKIYLPLIIFFFIASALAQNESDPFNLGYMDEDIACADLPQALTKYNEDIHLERLAAKNTLSALASFLQSALDNNKFDRAEFREKTRGINDILGKIQVNDTNLLIRGDNIHYSLTECLNPSDSEE